MKSADFRSSPEMLRNEFPVTDLGMPIIARQEPVKIDAFLSIHDIKKNDAEADKCQFLVHCFKDDYKFESLYVHPYSKRNVSKLSVLAQYSAVCSPDFSVYAEMPRPVQKWQVFKSRWCGAYWQDKGLCVFPSVTWASKDSFDFCFDGIQQNSVVVVSTVGVDNNDCKADFMTGYDKMLEVIQPSQIICYGKVFPEMDGNVVGFSYRAFRKKVG